MESELKIFAIHFEPTKDNYYSSFLNPDGNFKFNPEYEIELKDIDFTELSEKISLFPKKLDADWMCAAIYRDVLIWRDNNGQVVKTFELCFSCDHYLFSDGVIENINMPIPYGDNIFVELIDWFKLVFKNVDESVNYSRIGTELNTSENVPPTIKPISKEKKILPIKRPWLKE